MTPHPLVTGDARNRPDRPFRSAVLRGLGVLVPPLLTIVIFLWVGNTIDEYLLRPVTFVAREAILWHQADIRDNVPLDDPAQHTVVIDGRMYRRLPNDTFVPEPVFDHVRRNHAAREPLPQTGEAVYRRYIDLQYLRPYYVMPLFLVVFVGLLYLLGNFMAAGIGHFFWRRFEQGVHRLPLVRSVYSSVKQVTDFLFSESNIEYTRVVAIEYPREGIWSLGFVTGESLVDIRGIANEPVVSLLMCTSPAPMTGFTITVRKSEIVDLNITIDQALQYIVSCGVVVPPQQVLDMARPQEGSETLPVAPQPAIAEQPAAAEH